MERVLNSYVQCGIIILQWLTTNATINNKKLKKKHNFYTIYVDLYQ